MSNILLVDDDIELSSMVAEYLGQEGFAVQAVHDGEAGVMHALSGNFDLVVLDVMMPRLNGVEALGKIRRESRIPVIMLTAKGDDLDRILGLEYGADDYVPKPCTPRELVARIRAILRRSQPVEPKSDIPEHVQVGPLSLWPEKRLAEWKGVALSLTSTEFNLLETLARNAGKVVSKAGLSEQALGRPLARFDRSVDVHVSSIRQKLGKRPDGLLWIETVRGMGYQFIRD